MESPRSAQPSLRGASLQLVLASFLVLALELVLIRWLPGQVRVIAYFPNLILIGAFLGLGIGCLVPRRIPLAAFPLAILALAVVAISMSGVAFTHRTNNEYLWLLYFDLPRGARVVEGIRLPILAIFVLNAAVFVPLGRFVADRLREFKEAGRPLAGYAADLLGSLLGAIGISLLFFSGAKPVVWFSVVMVASALLFLRQRKSLALTVMAGVVLIVLVAKFERAQTYSPYYALSAVSLPQRLVIMTNGSLHQVAAPLRRVGPSIEGPFAKMRDSMREGYHLPYDLLGRKPRKVLVLGAGSGNDVSVALDRGAERVDAVEIDPGILRLGALHPERPYSSPRVRTFNTDARAFLNDSKEKYDLIVFGTLDSMTRLSALSNVRLDNYVYTVESLRAARRHLTPDGGVAMYFMVGTKYIEGHIAAMVVEAMDQRPNVIVGHYSTFNRIFLSGPAFVPPPELAGGTLEEAREVAATLDVPTDDWPFLYLRSRGITPFYLSLIGAILAIAIVAVFAVSREMRRSVATRTIDVPMFLFGMAFLLIETRLVTEMNLVWGATWLTSAIVFASILLMILGATIWMQSRSVPWAVAATGLVAALAATWIIPVDVLVGQPIAARLVGSILFIGTPILFASICFAILFRERPHPDVAFGWNMLGAVVGGLLEFSSMAVGIKATTLLALVAYLLAMLVVRRERDAAVVKARGFKPA